MPTTPTRGHHRQKQKKEFTRRLRDLEVTFSHYLPSASLPSPYSTPSRPGPSPSGSTVCSSGYHQLSTPPTSANITSTTMMSSKAPNANGNGSPYRPRSDVHQHEHDHNHNDELRPMMNVSNSYTSAATGGSLDGPPVHCLPGKPPLFNLIKCIVAAVTVGLVVGSVASGLTQANVVPQNDGIASPGAAATGSGGGSSGASGHKYWSKPNEVVDPARAKEMAAEAEQDARDAIARAGGKPAAAAKAAKKEATKKEEDENNDDDDDDEVTETEDANGDKDGDDAVQEDTTTTTTKEKDDAQFAPGYPKKWHGSLRDKEEPGGVEFKYVAKWTDGTYDPNPDLPFPRLAWLLSFPNSGTSYTMKLVETATGHHVASNYGDHNLHKVTKLSEPFYEDDATFAVMRSRGSIGPFIADAGGKKMTRTTRGYVITKTHCGGYCFKCAPSKYALTDPQFLLKCASGGWVYRDEFKSPDRPIKSKTTYDPRLISRAVHLIRNPFDNIVSRYHLEHNHMERYDRQKDLAKYDREKDGFRKFCKQLNKNYASEELEFAKAVQKETGDDALLQALEYVQDVPCYQDLFKYINWHNHAFRATEELKVPTLLLHYEEYEADFDATLETLLEFLDQPLASDFTKEFIEGKSYAEEYFTEDERHMVKKAVKLLASDELHKEIQRYFD
mmetsp:Transcript_27784/g.80214  ORF Transcript_27784/g.80214 Transcript_27784/m.80214 type:complete len:672 (+) Transcript_27784:29-2044(+)